MSHTIDERCNGCSACERQCPTNAITGTFKVRYDVAEHLCIECGVCGRICPVEAVHDEHGARLKHVPRAEREHPLIDEDTCTGCALCIDACRFNALVLEGRPYDGTVVLDAPELCTGCAECVRICSKEAVAMGRLDLRTYDPVGLRRRLRSLHRRDATGTDD